MPASMTPRASSNADAACLATRPSADSLRDNAELISSQLTVSVPATQLALAPFSMVPSLSASPP